jgi:hypothetical protein
VALWESGEPDDRLGPVLDHFGISVTAARYHVWNALQRRVPLESIGTARYKPDPAWEAREAYTVMYHPIAALVERPARAGRFSGVVVRAAQDTLVSWDTAAEWLLCDPSELRRKASDILSLYPEVARNV